MFGRDADRELKALLERDKEGMRAVVRAREVAKMMDEKNGKQERGKGREVKKNDKRKVSAKGSRKASTLPEELDSSGSGSDSDSDLVVEDPTTAQKNAYSAQVIKHLGFDPTMKPGQKRADDSTVMKKVCITCYCHVKFNIRR
jgi:minichromosome maintenance protein 10